MYDVEFSSEACLNGNAVDVLVKYPNDFGEVDVFLTDSNGNELFLINDKVSQGEIEYFHEKAEDKHFEQMDIEQMQNDYDYMLPRRSVDAFTRYWGN